MHEIISPARGAKRKSRPEPNREALAIQLANAHVLGSMPDQNLEHAMLDTVLALMIRHRLRIDHAHVLGVVREAIADADGSTSQFVDRCLGLFELPTKE